MASIADAGFAIANPMNNHIMPHWLMVCLLVQFGVTLCCWAGIRLYCIFAGLSLSNDLSNQIKTHMDIIDGSLMFCLGCEILFGVSRFAPDDIEGLGSIGRLLRQLEGVPLLDGALIAFNLGLTLNMLIPYKQFFARMIGTSLNRSSS